jgi:apolipoprotein N-acyltransferase
MTEVAVRNQVQPVGDSLMERIRTGFFDSVNWLSGFLQDMAVTLAALAPVLVVLIPIIILIIIIVRVVRARRRR